MNMGLPIEKKALPSETSAELEQRIDTELRSEGFKSEMTLDAGDKRIRLYEGHGEAAIVLVSKDLKTKIPFRNQWTEDPHRVDACVYYVGRSVEEYASRVIANMFH
jgi:hypothetical protein